MKEPILRLWHIVDKLEKHSPYVDERRKVNSWIVAYIGPDNAEYRKRFNSYGEPKIPESGTHQELNALENQF